MIASADLMIDKFRQFGEEGLEQWLANLDQSVISIDELKGGLGLLATTMPEEEFEILRQALLNVEGAAAGVTEEVTATGEAIVTAATSIEEAMEALGLVSLEDLEGQLDALNVAIDNELASAETLVDAWDELREAYKKAGEEIPLEQQRELLLKLEAMGAVLTPAQVAMLGYAEAMERAAAAAKEAAGKQVDLTNRVQDFLGRTRGQLEGFGDSMLGARKGVVEFYTSISQTGPPLSALEKVKEGFGNFFDKLKEGIGGLLDPENIAGFLGGGLDQLFSGDIMGGVENIASDLGGSIGGAIGSAFGPIGSMIGKGLGKLAGKAVGWIKGLFGGKPEWEKIGEDVAKAFGKGISEELAKQIEETSKDLGNRAAAITKHLPDIIKEQGVESAAALGTFVGKAGDFLTQLDAGVFTSGEAFGGLSETLQLLIPEMDKVGASAETTQQIFGTLTEAMNRVATGAATAQEAQTLLSDTFPLLVERMDQMGAAGVMGIRGIIEQTRALGIEVEAVTDFVLEQTGRIIDGVGKMTDNLVSRLDRIEEQLPKGLGLPEAMAEAKKIIKVEGSAIFDELAKIASGTVPEMEAAGEDLAEAITEPITKISPEVARALVDIKNQAMFAAGAVATAFSEMLAEGIPITEIVEKTRPQLEGLKDVFERLGVEAPEAFNKISQFARKLAKEDVALVIEGVQGMGQAMEGLRDLGMATQQDFDAFATTLGSSFDQLREQGLTQKQTFAALGPQLQTMADLARDFGFEVDEATAKLLEEAAAQGVVKGATLDMADAVSAGFQGMFDRFDAFLEKQGIATDEMFNFGEQATTAMQQVQNETDTTADNFATQWQTSTSAATDSLQTWANQGEQTSTTVSDTFVAMAANISEGFDQTSTEAQVMMESITTKAELTGQAIEGALNRKFNVDVEFGDNLGGGRGDEDGDEERPAFQHGSGGFQHFGAGTDATLHGEEEVLTRQQGGSIAAMVERAISRGGGEERVTVVPLVVDGMKIAEAVIKHTPRALANKGLGRG
jgi:hypothetical protein